jgi:hypothetical protein
MWGCLSTDIATVDEPFICQCARGCQPKGLASPASARGRDSLLIERPCDAPQARYAGPPDHGLAVSNLTSPTLPTRPRRRPGRL